MTIISGFFSSKNQTIKCSVKLPTNKAKIFDAKFDELGNPYWG